VKSFLPMFVMGGVEGIDKRWFSVLLICILQNFLIKECGGFISYDLDGQRCCGVVHPGLWRHSFGKLVNSISVDGFFVVFHGET